MINSAKNVLLLLACCFCSLQAEDFSQLKTIGTMGKNERILANGAEAAIFEHVGAGVLNHLWIGGKHTDSVRIRYYIDGEAEASIDMDLYMGHGIGFKEPRAPWANRYMGKIGKNSGLHNNYQIPFGKSVRVTAQIQTYPEDEANPQLWWIIRGIENGKVQIGKRTLPDEARLKLYRKEDYTAKPMEEVELFNSNKSGAVFLVAVAAKSVPGGRRLTYLEGCVRGYFPDQREPLLMSSGMEDYFLGTYYFNTGYFVSDTGGLTHINKKVGSFSAFRIHDADPVFFSDGMSMTVRNGETMHGTIEGEHFLEPPSTTYTTYTWVYEW
ncbi:MAG: DUF2961 domain-containing protein [Puniceicoccaceae bacterium]